MGLSRTKSLLLLGFVLGSTGCAGALERFDLVLRSGTASSGGPSGVLAFISANPSSPTNTSTTPLIVGTAPTDAVTVMLYSDSSCMVGIGSGTKTIFESSGITATV